MMTAANNSNRQPPPPPPDRTAKEIVGTVAAVLWSQPYEAIVAKLTTGHIVRGPIDDMTIDLGATLRFLGRWESHAKHGDQFAFTTYVADTTLDRAGIVKYLSDIAPNVGRARAESLWIRFGPDAVRTLRENPQAIADAGVMPADQAAAAAEALAANATMERTKIDLFSLFAGRGFPGRIINSCIGLWGARAAQQIRQNPFSLLAHDMPGAGFRRCDRMFLDLGGKRDRLKRQMLCAWSSLREDTTGHTWFRSGYAEDAVRKLCSGPNVDPIAALVMGKRGGWISTRRDPKIRDRVWVAEADKAGKELDLSTAILRLQLAASASGRCLWPIEFPAGLSEHQLEKLGVALAAPVAILAGTPGTGKTYAAAAIIRQLADTHGISNVAVAAPTGKAAVRCSASMRRYQLDIEATTIHRLLGITRNGHDGKGWGFAFNKNNPLPYRFLVIDESSMLDTSLAGDLFAACADGTHVLLIGDPYQLPPVGHGAPLRDMLASGAVPFGELSEIRRNAGMIVEACSSIKAGKPFAACNLGESDETQRNLEHVEAATSAAAVEQLLAIVRSVSGGPGGASPIWDIQVIVAVNEIGDMSRAALNELLQRELNPNGKQIKPNPFRVGDKVICLKNGWVPLAGDAPHPSSGNAEDAAEWSAKNVGGVEAYVANGEIGAVLAIAPKLTIVQFFGPDRVVRIPMGRQKDDDGAGGKGGATSAGSGRESGRGCDYDLAYAITGHKSQGSEWPTVIVMIDDQAGFVASREWVYTAISRAAKRCYLIGKRAVVDKQCRRQVLVHRKTFLRELLAGEAK